MSHDKKIFNVARSPNVFPVTETMPADLLTPLAVYLKLANGNDNSFLLESVEGGESLARYSFIGVEPDFIISGNNAGIKMTTRNGDTWLDVPMIRFLRDHFNANRIQSDPDLPAFSGGAIGLMGFGCTEWFEPVLRRTDASAEPDAEFMFCRTTIAFDHAKQIIKIITLVFEHEVQSKDTSLDALISEAAAKNLAIRKRLETDPVTLPARAAEKINPATSSNFTRSDFETSVKKVKDYIYAGDAYQVVLSQCFTRSTTASPVGVYRAIRRLNPSPYMFLISINGRALIGASPEMLVRVSGDRVEYRPIAGTRPRGADPVEDAILAEEMRADKKEVAEHLMLVDLGRNDLGRVAEYGSVKVSDLMSVERYSHVQHLVTQLTAKLRPGLDRFDALAACFPAGTVSGAPKVSAIQIINELEPTPRGIYSGAVGYFDYSGNLDTCIAIRTLELKDGVAKVQAGAGIVADSSPEAEYTETVNKAAAMLKAIEVAENE
jgi:anthranilate synthase component I